MDETTRIQNAILSRMSREDRGYTSECWISDRSTNAKGYTKMGVRGVTWYTHRLAYTLWIGDIPEDLVVDHLCRQTSCCNPAHLEPVTHRVNLLRGETLTASEAAQTHCKRGHQLSGRNVYRRKDHPSKRECRTCRNSARHRRTAA